MKLLTIIGARPQFVKAGAVTRAARERPQLKEIIVHTGQHYDENMSEIFFRELDLPRPHLNLNIGSGPHGQQTGRMLEALERTMLEIAPDRVLVYGDTNSTLAGALAAVKMHIPVAHVEAGLRSFNRQMPEEINRIATDHVASRLYPPTTTATANLLREGIAADAIVEIGDVMYDAYLHYVRQAPSPGEQLGLARGSYVLATVHRAENTDDPERFSAIWNALLKLSRTLPVVFPMHPRTRQVAARLGLLNTARDNGGMFILDPVGYLEMIGWQSGAGLIVTDSGGVQKEAYFSAVPCATLRDETEWTELVAAGWNTLVPPDDAEAMALRLVSLVDRPRPVGGDNFYGDGTAAMKVVDDLLAS